MKIFESITKVVKSISRAVNMVALGVLSVMMLLTVSDVFLRFFFSKPIMGATELTESLIVVLGSLGLVWCAVERAHLKVDLVVSRFPPRVQAIIDSFTCFVGMGLCAVISWRSFMEGLEVKRLNFTSSLLGLPQFPFYWVLALGLAMLCLVMVTILIQNITKAVKG